MAEPPGVTLSFAEAQGFELLGEFLQTICAPSPITVVRAIGNTAPGVNTRVPEPIVGDFVILTQGPSQTRLEWNETSYADNVLTGSISGTTLTVSSVAKGAVPIGALLFDGNWPQVVIPNTVVQQQLTGDPGGIGTYQVSVSQQLNTEALYAGQRSDVAAAEWVVQLDIHGPNSSNNVRAVATMFRSDYATDWFAAQGLQIAPLFCDDGRYLPFENAEQQMEFRWVMEAHFQVGAVVTTPQQFFTQAKVETVEAAAIYTGP
jgi:hypothetical protein